MLLSFFSPLLTGTKVTELDFPIRRLRAQDGGWCQPCVAEVHQVLRPCVSMCAHHCGRRSVYLHFTFAQSAVESEIVTGPGQVQVHRARDTYTCSLVLCHTARFYDIEPEHTDMRGRQFCTTRCFMKGTGQLDQPRAPP